jgi:molecular chaperone GrpE
MNASIFRSSSYFLNRFTRIARQPRFNWNITIQPRQLAFPFSSDSCKKPEVEPNSKSLEDILKECDTLREENKSLLDKYKRSLADAENLRKRSNKQIEEAKIFAVQNFCKDLLEVCNIIYIWLSLFNKTYT